MTRDTSFAVIELHYVQRSGYLYVTSPDVPGLHLCGSDFRAVCDDVIPAVKTLFKLNRGIEVDVVPETEIDVFPRAPQRLELPIGKSMERLVAVASKWFNKARK
jgi:hypothetical protein